MILNIEIKDDSDDAIKKTVGLVAKYDRWSTTILGGEAYSITKRVRQLDARVCTFACKEEIMALLLFHFMGLLPYLEIEADHLALPYMTRDFIAMKY